MITGALIALGGVIVGALMVLVGVALGQPSNQESK